MPIRLWPKDYAKKDHISQGEKILLRNAARNLKEGHFAVDIDPVRMSTSAVKMGLYLSPSEGLVTFSLYTGEIDPSMLDAYIMYVQMVEDKIYERLLDSKMLIVRTGEYKVLKFPYKHMVLGVLADALNNTEKGTRLHDVLEDILENNPYQHLSDERKQRVKNLFKGYKTLTGAMKQELMSLGFEISDDGKHYKITYQGDPRYMVTIGKTPSDNRAGSNNAGMINKIML